MPALSSRTTWWTGSRTTATSPSTAGPTSTTRWTTTRFCLRAAERTAADEDSLGIVIGGSGNGEQIAANKVKGIRAILAWSVQTAELGREHNNANVISVGGRMHTQDEVVAFIDAS